MQWYALALECQPWSHDDASHVQVHPISLKGELPVSSSERVAILVAWRGRDCGLAGSATATHQVVRFTKMELGDGRLHLNFYAKISLYQ